MASAADGTHPTGMHSCLVPVCPHAGGVGMCELVQHLSFFDYIAVSGSLENRYVYYVGDMAFYEIHFPHNIKNFYTSFLTVG